MSNIKLDLGQFKHLKSDEHTTTLQHHKLPHTITLHHKSLSKANQEQLKALANVAKDTATPSQKQESDPHYGKVEVRELAPQPVGKVIRKAEGGEVSCPHCGAKKYAEGDQVEAEDPTAKYGSTDFLKKAEQAYPPQSPEEQHKAAFEANLQSQRNQNYSHLPESDLAAKAEQKTIEQEKAKQEDIQSEAQMAAYNIKNTPIGARAGQEAAQQVPNSPVPEQPIQAPVTPESQAPEAGAPAAPTAAPGLAQTPTVPVKPAHHTAPEEAQTTVASDWAALKQDAMNGHIQAKSYADLMGEPGTLRHAQSVFALILGGIGSGLTGKPNAALEMMDKEIERDLQAQKTNRENKINVYKISIDEARQKAEQKIAASQIDVNSAQAAHIRAQAQIEGMQLAHMRANGLMLDEMARAAKRIPDIVNGQPNPEKMKANQALMIAGQYMNEKNASIADLAAAKTAMLNMSDSSGGDALWKINQAKNIYGEHIANEAMKELPEYEKKQQVMSGVDAAMKEMKDNAMYAHLPITPGGQRYAAAKAKVKTLTSEIFGGKSEQEFKIIEGFFPKASTTNDTYKRQRESLMQKLESQSAFPVLSRLGIVKKYQWKTAPNNNSRAVAEEWLRNNPNHPKAAAIRKQLGK